MTVTITERETAVPIRFQLVFAVTDRNVFKREKKIRSTAGQNKGAPSSPSAEAVSSQSLNMRAAVRERLLVTALHPGGFF